MKNIFIVFGENINLCKVKSDEIKDNKVKNGYQTTYLDCKDQNPLQKIFLSDLFSDKRFFIVKNISKLNTSDQEKFISKLKGKDNPEVLIIGETVPAKILKSLMDNANVFEFKYPRVIYRFLESYYPGNEKNSLKLLNDVLKDEQPEFVFALLARHIIDLISVPIVDEHKFPPWKLQRLKRQLNKFTPALLKKILYYMADLDVGYKKGLINIRQALDLLVIKKLE